MTSSVHKHRITLLPDGVRVSDCQPVSKRSKECYDSVSPCHIPKITVSMNIQAESEQIAIKIPSDVLDKIPMLNDFQQLALLNRSDPVHVRPLTTSDIAADYTTAASKKGGRTSAKPSDGALKRLHRSSGRSQTKAPAASGAIANDGDSSAPLADARDSSGARHESNSAVLQLPGGSWGLLVMLKVLLDRRVDLDRVLLVDAIEPAGTAALAVCLYLSKLVKV